MCRKVIIPFSILLLLFLEPAGLLYAQYEEKNFTRYTVRDGLSDNSIQTIEQDDQGYIWIGTEGGLNRFDGSNFKKFYTADPPVNLRSSSIWRIKKFDHNEIGIATLRGFQLLNTKTYTVKNYFIPDSTRISAYLNADWDVLELPEKTYGVTSATGFYLFERNGKLLFRYDKYVADDIGKKRILYGRDILQLDNDRYIVYVDENRVAIYDHKKRTFAEMTAEEEKKNNLSATPLKQDVYWSVRYPLSAGEFIFIRGRYEKAVYYNHALHKITESVLPKSITDSVSWESRLIKLNDSVFALNSGVSGFHLLKLNRKTGTITTDGIKHLRNYKIICLYYDRDGRIWAGTTQGLLKQELEPPVITSFHYPSPKGIKFAQGFNAVYRYKDRIYAGRFAYSFGLVIIDATTMKAIKEITLVSDNTSWNEIRSIEMYHRDTLWIGTNSGLLWFDTKTEHYGKVLDPKKYPWSIDFFPVLAPPRPDGNAWMCSMMNGKVVRYNIPTRTFTLFSPSTNPAIPFVRTKAVVYDSYGDVWISGHSLARWNNSKQAFDTVFSVYGGENKFNDDIVTIRSDDNGSLWFHNTSNGLLQYSIRERKFVNYNMKNGAPADVILSLSPVIDNKIWLAGNSQLSFFDISKKQFTVYDYKDGLPEPKPTARRIYYDSLAGYLYLCCNEYIARFHHSPPIVKDRSSDLVIEEVNVNNEQFYYNADNKIRIPYNRNNLVISSSVVDFDKSNYWFSWRLNNGSWNISGSQRTINLNNLSPGDYKLEIKASGKPGVEKLKTLYFSINPPYWKTVWFIGIALLLLGSAAYYLYRRRIHYIRQRAELDKQLSQTEMKALQAQMNPHFIFNSLNSIREMILNNENKDASHYLSKFAHLIRITLDQSLQPMVSLRNTVDYLQRYLEMENIRNSVLSYQISIAPSLDTDEIVVPPMLIQPFIENALWHGVSAGNRSIHIKVNFVKQDESLVCTVEDNGIGINQSLKNKSEKAIRHKPLGIENIKNRIALLNEKYDLFVRVDIRDKKDIPGAAGTGTVVTLYLPLEMANT